MTQIAEPIFNLPYVKYAFGPFRIKGDLMKRTILIALFSMAATACVTTDPGPAIPAAPLISNYRAEAERVIASSLRDPASARYEHRDAPYRLECDRGVFTPAKQEFWAAEVWVNARNGYGGYTGPQPYTVIYIPNGTGGTDLRANRGLGGGNVTAASGICRRIGA